MTHPEEHILELYVLNAESVSARRAEIDHHLRTCAGCKALVAEMSGFYGELDRELGDTDEPAAASAGRAMMKRIPDLALWEERLARGPWSGWGTPVKKLRHYIRRYPVATAGATFAFAAIAGIALFMGYGKLTNDVNPSYAVLNSKSGFFEVYDGRNELLWKRIVWDMASVIDQQGVSEALKFVVIDLDHDGSSEVVTPLVLSGTPTVPKFGLHIFDGRGDFRTIPYERKVNFRGTPYEYPNLIDGGCMMAVDTSDPVHPEVFVIAKTDRSPTAVLRINAKGEILGEYWHHGQMPAIYIHDVDGDGRNELIACGFNDVDDQTELASPFVVVLDPKKIVGIRESQVTRGYGFEKSDAEIYYIKFPLTEANTMLHKSAAISRMRDVDGRLIFLWGFPAGPEIRYDLDFVFSKSFEPLRVISTTQIAQFFDSEYRKKNVSTRLDEACLETLRSRIRFWDGKEWSGKPVRLGGRQLAKSAP